MKLFRRVLILLMITLFALVLTFVGHFLTREQVSANELSKKEAAFAAVYPHAASFDEADYKKEYLQRYLTENGYPDDQVYVNKVTFARSDVGDVIGIVVQVSAYKKYGGIIRLLVGVQNDGTVNGYSVLHISDVKGLDMKIKDATFAEQFAGKRVSAFSLVNYEAKNANEIVAANGADDASQAVLSAVNASLLTNIFVDEYFGGVW